MCAELSKVAGGLSNNHCFIIHVEVLEGVMEVSCCYNLNFLKLTVRDKQRWLLFRNKMSQDKTDRRKICNKIVKIGYK